MKTALPLFMLLVVGCGGFEKGYDQMQYESLTNEVGTIHVFSGGVEVRTYEHAKIIYSASDSQTMWIETSDGHRVYIQGDVVIDIEQN